MVALRQVVIDKVGHYNGLFKLEAYLSKRLVIVSKTFSGQTITLRRRVLFFAHIFTFIVYFFKYAYFSFGYTNDELSFFGEFIYKIYRMRVISAIAFLGLGLNGTIALMHYFYETHSGFKCLQLLHHLMQNTAEYRLGVRNTKKMCVLSYVGFIFFVRLIPIVINLIFDMILVYVAVQTYYDTDIEDNALSLTINVLITLYNYHEAWIIISSESVITCLSVQYFNYLFKEVWITMKLAIQKSNRLVVIASVRRLYRAIELIRQIGNYIDYFIGLIYVFGSTLIVIAINMAMDQDSPLIYRIFFAFTIAMLIVLIYVVNLVFASISQVNKSETKHLYRLFNGLDGIDNRSPNIRFKLDVEELISRLNSEFIGFYCLNLFKFTKLSFYEYFISLSSLFILVSGVISKF